MGVEEEGTGVQIGNRDLGVNLSVRKYLCIYKIILPVSINIIRRVKNWKMWYNLTHPEVEEYFTNCFGYYTIPYTAKVWQQYKNVNWPHDQKALSFCKVSGS